MTTNPTLQAETVTTDVVEVHATRRPWTPAVEWGERVVREARPGIPAPPSRWRALERSVVFFVPLTVYLICAYVMVIEHHDQQGDSGSRLANAYYVFFGKDPHLAAIGFVWQPLTSMTEWPLLFLKGIYPDLTRVGFDANIMSSLFMAGVAYQLYRFFEDLGLGAFLRWPILALTMVNPLMVYYGCNGMSEALFLFCLTCTTRHLARWIDGGGTRPLLMAAVWLGFSYGTRNESVFSAGLGVLVVGAIGYFRAQGALLARRKTALTDVALFVAPFLLVFLGWAVTSYIIVGELFEQLSSQYGNSAEIAALGRKASKVAFLKQALGITFALAPFLPLGAIGAALRGLKTRDLRFLAVLAIPGGVLLFEILAYADGQLNQFERYFIYAIPMLAMLGACLAVPLQKSDQERSEEYLEETLGIPSRYLRYRRQQRIVSTSVLGLLAVFFVGVSVVSSGNELWNSYYGTVDKQLVEISLDPHSHGSRTDPIRNQYAAILSAASYISQLHAPRGGILVDDFDEYVDQIILAAQNPDVFTTPNDQGWEETFGIPYQFGIRYIILAEPGTAIGNVDQLNKQFPTLYQTGQGLATQIHQFTIPAGPTFRIFRVKPETA